MSLGALALAFAVAQPAQAQDIERDGIFFGGGAAYGSLDVEDFDNREDGFGWNAKIGTAVKPTFLVGVEATGYEGETEAGSDISMQQYVAAAYLYPNAGNFYIRGGLGVAQQSLDFGIVEGSDTGLALTLGVGYDITLTERLAITPFADFDYSNFDENSANVFRIGAGLNWY